MLHHPDGPLATALLAVEGRADATLAEVIAIEAMLREAWNDPALADYHAERDQEYRERFDPQRDALEESDRAWFEEGGAAL